jgi:hypothetical protein
MKTHHSLQESLLDYYFGSITDEKRLLVEEELISSQAFLVEFIALKRKLEVSFAYNLVPSPAARQRLRKEVARVFPAQHPAEIRTRPLWMKLAQSQFGYQGALAVGVILLVLFGNLIFTTGRLKSITSSKSGAADQQHHRLIDSAGDLAASAHYL